MEDLYKYEKELWNKGIDNVAGVDEVGRGPLFGPVVATCVVLPHDFILEGLNDSKKISEKKRNIYYEYIMDNALVVKTIFLDHNKIDEINIYQASKLAMNMAIEEASNEINIDYILSDAMPLENKIESTAIIKGDSKSITIAAASVIAKVERDNYMKEIDKKYPMYGFKNHNGYPTKKHLEALNDYGLIEGYRKTYGPVKKLLEE